MKKITLLLLTVILSGMVFAQELPISIQAGGAVTVETGDNVMEEDSDGFDALAGVFNMFKVGGYVDAIYNINEFVGVGAELGFYTFPTEDGEATALFDIPVLAIVEGNLFDVLKVKGHFGYTLSNHITADGLEYANKFDLGAKFFLGGLYLDYTMLFWGDSKSSIKWGLGFEFPIM